MSNLNTDNLRPPFFPNKSSLKPLNRKSRVNIERNDISRKSELDNISKNHAKVKIDARTRDFGRIKKAVDSAPEIDRSDYLKKLKDRIASGEYSVDPEKIAEKMILNEF